MVEVNVREEDLAHVAEAMSLCDRSARRRFPMCRRWAGIDERDAGGAVNDSRRDDFRNPEEIQVDVVQAGCQHRHSLNPP